MIAEELTITWLLVLAPIVAALAITARPYVPLLFGIILVFVPRGDWQLGGVRLDPVDLVLLGVVMASVLRRFGPNFVPGAARPYLRLWVAVGVLTSLAYIQAPVNQEHLTDPIRAGYQLYRYCWKPIIYYPLILLMIANDRDRLNSAIVAIIIAGDALALQATLQGYSGEVARGPFFGGNALGGALVVPLVMALSRVIQSRSRRDWIFAGASMALMARGLLFASSRGALVATTVAFMTYAALLARTGGGRRRFVQLAGMGVAGLTIAFVAQPDLLQRPNVAHLLTALQGTHDANLQWRMTERWPHFWAVILDHPWLGTGSAVDLTLSRHANTPHSGYLALAMVHGLPATATILLAGLLAALHGTAVFRRSGDVDDRLFGAAATAGLSGLFVHNLVESTLLLPFTAQIYWTLIALVAARRFAPALQLASDDEDSVPVRSPIPRRTVRMVTYGGGN